MYRPIDMYFQTRNYTTRVEFSFKIITAEEINILNTDLLHIEINSANQTCSDPSLQMELCKACSSSNKIKLCIVQINKL